MGSTYNGLPGDISLPAAVSIASSTNASPIAVTTSTPHGLLTGDRADVANHQTNTGANGIWTIVRTGASTLTLTGSTGTGVGGATGTVQPLTYGAAATIPSDGDPRNAASVNVPLIAALDRTALVLPAIGVSKLAQRSVVGFISSAGNSWASHPGGSLTAGTVNQWNTVNALSNIFGGAGFAFSAGSSPLIFAVHNFVSGDLAIVDFEGTDNSQTAYRLGLYGAVSPPGVTPTWPGSFGVMSTSFRTINNNADATPNRPFALRGFFAPASTGDLYIVPVIYAFNTGASTNTLLDDASFTVDFWRPTGVSQ